jgi:hypothetical protein
MLLSLTDGTINTYYKETNTGSTIINGGIALGKCITCPGNSCHRRRMLAVTNHICVFLSMTTSTNKW